MSSLRFGYSGCARTLRFNMSHTCLLGFKSFECSTCVCYTYNLCASIHTTWCVIIFQHHLQLKRIWGKGTDRMTSFGCHFAFMFPGMRTTILCVHGSACALSGMFIFAILNVFHTRQFTKNTFLLKNDNYLAVHEKPEHIAIFTPTVPHGWFCT